MIDCPLCDKEGDHDFAKKGLALKFFFSKIAFFKLRAEQTGATKRITDGGLKPKVAGQFF